VNPGADPGRIRLRYTGASAVRRTPAGALLIETPVACFEDAEPTACQEVGGRKVAVDASYAVESTVAGSAFTYGFRVGDYDRDRALILDPVILIYSGFICGVSHDYGEAIAVDRSGNAYVTGDTGSTQASFPVRVGPSLTLGGASDAFVAKVHAAGTHLVYCGYIGGASWDSGGGIAVDTSGSAYVVGQTQSNEKSFPVRVGPDLTYNGGKSGDAFIAKVNPAGTALVYCGYVGGTGSDNGEDVAVDGAGNAYVVGTTDSDERSFPVRVGPDLTHNGLWDAFVAKVNASGAALVYCGYIGGRQYDGGVLMARGYTGIEVDEGGHAFVAGYTMSDEQSFPVTVGPDLTYNGNGDAFVTKVDRTGARLLYCGYIGGSSCDTGVDIAIDGQGNAFVTGDTYSDEKSFPVKRGPDLTYNGNCDTFVAGVNSGGTGLDYCGYLGGSQNEHAAGISVDRFGLAYVTGLTGSDERTFPVVDGPDVTFNGRQGGSDTYIAAVANGGGSLFYCGYIGGTGPEEGRGIAVDPAGNAYVAGNVDGSFGFPVRGGPFSQGGGLTEAFVCKVSVVRFILARGTPRPGGQITLSLIASDDANLPYQVGTSLGLGPIVLPDKRAIPLSSDPLLMLSVSGLLSHVFQGYFGWLDGWGRGAASINLPPWPALVGLRIHSAFITLGPISPLGIQSISNPISFTITR